MNINEISIFKIYKADATYDDHFGSLHVKLFYPRNIKEETKRIPENLAFGIKTLESLLKEGHAQIADTQHPFRPADGGSIYVFTDNTFLVHRRDKGAPMHKLYHGVPGGYTDTLDSTFTEQGLLETGLRETAEENLLITREKPHRLIVPNDAKYYTLQSAKNIGLDLKPVYIDMKTLPSKDKLEVFYENGEHIFNSEGKGFLDIEFEGSTSFSLMQIHLVPFSSDEILPIDAEGMPTRTGKWIHFNRESYLLNFSEIENKIWGSPLNNPRVYKTKIKNGKPIVYTPEYQKPFLGPEATKVIHPHIWGPENHTTVCLDALGIKGYNRLEAELWKNKTKLKSDSLIPKEYSE